MKKIRLATSILFSFGIITVTSLAIIDLSAWSILHKVALSSIGIMAIFGLFWKN